MLKSRYDNLLEEMERRMLVAEALKAASNPVCNKTIFRRQEAIMETWDQAIALVKTHLGDLIATGGNLEGGGDGKTDEM